MSEDSVLHGLNIDEEALHGDLHRSSGAASSVNRDLELAMWTNLHFPEEPMFSPERDQASKSRHKLVDSPPLVASSSSNGVSNPAGDPVANGFGFFGSVGASLLPEMGRGKPSGSTQHHPAAAGMSGHGSLHDLFSWGMFDPSAHQALFGSRPDVTVDPFLSNNTTTTNTTTNTNSNEGAGGSGAQEVSPYGIPTGLPPLTIKDPQDLKAKQAALMAQNPHAIDPANTTIAPPPAKRARLPSLTTSSNNPGNMIPVNYTHPQTPTLHTALSGSDAGLDNDDMETSPLHAHVHGHSHSLSLDGQMSLDKNMSPAEDKRRRNTLASARFRAKKKEREAAMERKARELDEKVLDLERECEVLRKENNWLKGLVVGASTTTPPNGATATAVTEEPAPVTTIKESASAPNGPSSGVVEAAKGSVIDVDELLRVLKASGAVLTGNAVNGAEASAQKQGPTPATGKRKRSSAPTNN